MASKHASAFILTGIAIGSAVAATSSQTKQTTALDPTAYRAEWAALRPKLDAGIERHRKGDAAIEVVDAAGKPVTNATLTIRQKAHAFLFGSNILPLGQLGELNAAYEEKFVKLFNLATTTFCLGAIEPKKGQLRFAEGSEEIWRRPPPDRVLAFCKKHGIAMKGQPLLADSWHPEWAKTMTAEEARDLYRTYFKQVAERYGKEVLIFDVVNEAFLCKGRNKRRGWNFPLYTEDLSCVDWAFETAQPLFPSECRLAINEAAVGAPYFEKVKAILDKGIRLDGIGFQFHYFSPKVLENYFALNPHPDTLLKNYSKFSELKRPLYITEITIPTTLAPGAEGEAFQARAVEDLYRLWFSVPAMAGITYWNLCDGAAWGGAKGEGKTLAGLIDDRMREKPAYQALYQLIKREWNTQAQTVSDTQGKASFRGFYGTYDVVVTVGDKTQTFEIKLEKDHPTLIQLTEK